MEDSTVERIAELLRSNEALENQKENAEQLLKLMREQNEDLGRANSSLQDQQMLLRGMLLRVIKACNEHPSEAERLLSKDLFADLKHLARQLTR